MLSHLGGKKGVFVDVIMLRILRRNYPKSNDKCPRKRKAEGALTQKRRQHRGEGCVNSKDILG